MKPSTYIATETQQMIIEGIGVAIPALAIFLAYTAFVVLKRFARTGTLMAPPSDKSWMIDKYGDDHLYQKEKDYARKYEQIENRHQRRKALRRSARNRPNLP